MLCTALYLHVPLIIAAVFISVGQALFRNLRLGGGVFWRRYHVGGLRNLHCFYVNGIGHSHRKVLLGDAGKCREPARQEFNQGHFL